jgi:hypothetical protein
LESAYVDYQRASKALQSCDQSTDESPSREVLRLAMLEGQQRLAFEHYVEARIAFLEFRVEENDRPGPRLVVPIAAAGKAGIHRWLAAGWRPVLEAAAVLLLCAAVLSGIRQQRRLSEMERTRDNLSTALNQTRDRVQVLGQILETWDSQHSAVRETQQWESRAAAPAVPLQPKPQALERETDAATQVHSVGGHTYYTFSLAVSRQFERIGPIEVSLRSIDTQRNRVSLAIFSDASKMVERRLQLNQPIRLLLGYSRQALELVVNRIVGDRIDGGLVEPAS